MKSNRTSSAISCAALCAALAIILAGSSGIAQQTCFTDWSEAGPIVRKEGLAPIERVGELARNRASVEIVGSALCRSDERYVYRLTVRADRGVLRTIVVDARTPFDAQ